MNNGFLPTSFSKLSKHSWLFFINNRKVRRTLKNSPHSHWFAGSSMWVHCRLRQHEGKWIQSNPWCWVPRMEQVLWSATGSSFPRLVKELWIHATTSNHQVTFFVMGKKIVISEDLIGQLIGHDDDGIRCSDMADKSSYLTKISK